MKTKKIQWGESKFEFYKAPVNRTKQVGLILGALAGEAVLPMGITAFGIKKFLKWRPLFLVK